MYGYTSLAWIWLTSNNYVYHSLSHCIISIFPATEGYETDLHIKKGIQMTVNDVI